MTRVAPWTRRRLGAYSEALALNLLRDSGYTIEATNVRYPVGELDIVAREGHALCFVEVRSTTSEIWGGPFATINWRKRRRLIRAAQWYAQGLSELPPEIRFDVVAVIWEQDLPPRLELIRAAFDAS